MVSKIAADLAAIRLVADSREGAGGICAEDHVFRHYIIQMTKFDASSMETTKSLFPSVFRVFADEALLKSWISVEAKGPSNCSQPDRQVIDDFVATSAQQASSFKASDPSVCVDALKDSSHRRR